MPEHFFQRVTWACNIVLRAKPNPTIVQIVIMIRTEFNILSFAILLFVVFGNGSVAGQNKNKVASAPLAPEIIKSNLMVVDAAGKFVDSVSQADITILENGIEQKVTYFSKKEPELDLALVVDNSGSMRTKLTQLSFIGKTIVANLTDSDESTLLRFVARDRITVEQKWTRKKEQMYKAFDGLFVEGGQSAVADALYLSAQLMLDREKQVKTRRKAIIILTDAEDRASYYELTDTVNLLKNTDVQIFVLAFTDQLTDEPTSVNRKGKGKSIAENFARRISVETSGIAYVFGAKYTKENILDTIRSLMTELRSQYIVGYSPNDRKTQTPRSLVFTIADGPNGEKRKAIARDRIAPY